VSTLTRDLNGAGVVPSARPVDPRGRWEWPDPVEVPSSQVVQGAATRPEPLAARWHSEPLPSWPPLPEAETDARDDFDAIPSAQFNPDPYAAPPSVGVRQTPAAVQQDSATQAPGQWSGGHAFTAIPAEPQGQIDPSPSRLSYRLNRLWLTPVVRHFVRVGLPVLLMVVFVGGWLSDAGRRATLVEAAVSVRQAIENRPQFQVSSIAVQSRSPEVAQGVEGLLAIQFPISSFQLDLAAMRATAEALDAVDRASLQVRSGVLEVVIDERLPAMIWRNEAGLDLIDGTGHRVAHLASRAARADLPLIAGAGAPDAIAEARLLWAAATPLRERMRGLVRIGERRWDVVLDRNQRILLPAVGALGAFERVMALNMAQDVLAREVRVVDLRNPTRPTLRLLPEAMDELTRIRRESTGAQNR